MTRARPTQRRGFATTVALVAIVMVAATVLAMTNLLTMQAHRTRREAAGVQLRQMLLAGAAAAQRRLDDSAAGLPQNSEMLLPDPLTAHGGRLLLRFSLADSGAATVDVIAGLDTGVMRQTLVFEHAGERWVIRSAQITG